MEVYTTGQVSRICKVATSTVNKWFDSGQLKGYRVPGSRHRRIPRKNLIEFLKQHGVPLGELAEREVAKVLIVARDPRLVRQLKRALTESGEFRVGAASSGFEAGIQAESLQPDCVIVDFGIGRGEAAQICRRLRRNELTAASLVVALLSDKRPRTRPPLASVDEWFQKPFDAKLLAERVRTLLAERRAGVR